MTELFDGERIDYVNDSLKLIQKPDGLTFGTDALMLAAFCDCKGKRGLELGSGSGIISMLMLTRDKLRVADAIDVQEQYATLTERNAELNGLSDRLKAYHCDLRDFNAKEPYEVVFTNPPYMKTTSGFSNRSDAKNLARHEVMGDIGDFLACAKRTLKYGGAFYAVYRPDRLTDLIFAMRNNGIEPKKITFVHADPNSAPSMVLVAGRLGGGVGLKVTAPFYIYVSPSHDSLTDDMVGLLDYGCFPDRFTV